MVESVIQPQNYMIESEVISMVQNNNIMVESNIIPYMPNNNIVQSEIFSGVNLQQRV